MNKPQKAVHPSEASIASALPQAAIPRSTDQLLKFAFNRRAKLKFCGTHPALTPMYFACRVT